MIKDKIKEFVNKYNLAGTFIVAFSGGYDSMCLLDVLNKMHYDVVAIHLNHNWRGKESLNEEQACREFAKQNNIKYYTETLPDNIEKTETAAREARYAFFEKCSNKFNSNIIFTAHNFDDNAETVLYRIIKGTGTIGLQGIAEHRGKYYRPLLKVSRREIEEYINSNKLSPNIDSSNLNTNYKRNFIRHKIFPLLKEINPNVLNSINSLSELAKEDNLIINSNLSNNILNAPAAEQKRIIYNILVENNIDYDKEKIENIQKFIEENKNSKSGKTISLSNELWFFVNNKEAKVVAKTSKNKDQILITTCGKYKFGDYEFSIFPCNKLPEKFPKDSECQAFISTDRINFTLRYRQDGDRIQPLGSCGSQKLKKYLNEKKIPAYKKDKIILLAKEKEVFWVAGYGLNEKIKVVNKPTHVITLK